jgi:hypothetical protein
MDEGSAEVQAEGVAVAGVQLYFAAYNGNSAEVSSCLSSSTESIDWCHPEGGATALYVACEFGHSDCVDVLIDKGANLDAPRDDGATPLSRLCIDGQVDIATKLLAAGAAVDLVDANGLTPLWIACHNGQCAVAKMLLNARADCQRKIEGWSAFDLTQRPDTDEELRLLLLAHTCEDGEAQSRNEQTASESSGREAAAAMNGSHVNGADENRTEVRAPPRGSALERLRAVAVQAKAAYEVVYDESSQEELDAMCAAEAAAGELITLAIAQCDWVVDMSRAAVREEPGREQGGVGGSGCAQAAARRQDEDELPDWLVSAAMQLSPDDSALADSAPSVVRKSRPRRTRKTSD